MIQVTYQTYSPVLGKTFTDTKQVSTMADFRLFACSLFSGNWSIIKTETL